MILLEMLNVWPLDRVVIMMTFQNIWLSPRALRGQYVINELERNTERNPFKQLFDQLPADQEK